jgi:hypothetical protein
MTKPALPPGTTSASSKEPVTPVVFRKWPKSEGGGVIALFPTIEENGGLVSSYEHNGQHSAASLGLIHRTKAAKKDEYESLKRELEGAPYHYNLRVMSRVQRRGR